MTPERATEADSWDDDIWNDDLDDNDDDCGDDAWEDFWDEEHGGAVDTFVAAAERFGGRGAGACVDDVVKLGDAAVEGLAFHIRAIDTCNGLPQFSPYARYAAFVALLEIDTELSTHTAAAALADATAETEFHGYALYAAIKLDSEHLPAALRRCHRDAATMAARANICEALSGRREHSPETLAILIDYLGEDPGLGAAFLADYGDEAALPAVLSAFDRLPDEPTGDSVPVTALSDLYDIYDAIEALGGSLDAARRRKADRIHHAVHRGSAAHDRRLDAATDDLELAAATRGLGLAAAPYPPRLEPVRVTPRPGPNQPCACGSGKKSKKCCGG